MKFSLVTVSFNSAATIRDTIESVLSQSHPDIEYIVVDGASTDATVDIVKGYGDRIDVFVSEKDRGIYDAMNKGLRLATGDVVAFINSDDFYADPGVISRVNAVFESTGTQCVFADLDYVDRDNPLRVVREWRSRPFVPGAFRRGWHPAHPTFFVARDVYRQFGGFDEEFRISADYELMLRLLEAGSIRSQYLPSVLVKMRDGGDSNRSVGNIVRANIECYRAFGKNRLAASPLVMIRKPLSKFRQLFAAFVSG
ncbi:MAG: glycosyltransferase family 2 protein [Usitatibacter sp.]